MNRRLLSAVALAIAAAAPRGVAAQDVEMLGRRYGTTPPAAYFQERARNPGAFRFARGRPARMREAAELRQLGRERVPTAGPARAGPGGGPASVGLGPRQQPVVGDVYVPVVLGLFSDSPSTPPVLRTDLADAYFGTQPGTVASYYAEVSSDSITLFGDVQDWVTSTMTQAEVTGGISALGCCGIGDFIKTLLDGQSPAVDWGAYDNDGPDGVPNSGDDDGYVDALAVVHPTAGAECNGASDRIWAHKWTLSDASSDRQPYVTGTASGSGGFILVDDYFVQGALDCSATGLNDIGVFTHEMGHAFGLPDLYDTRSAGSPHDGAGTWELMASGTWGCAGNAPNLPCHMGAWSKAALGWVAVDTLPPDTDFGALTLPPVETSGVVFRVDAEDGSDEYFLLENRQSLGSVTFDQNLPAEGLLVWQIDAGVVDGLWSSNIVNAFDHMGVWLRQADGLDELGEPGGDRGDAGDPFPGETGNTAFHAATNPSARSYQGTAVGLSMLDIALAGDDVVFGLVTGFATRPDLVVGLTATEPQDIQLTVTSGTPPVVWMTVGGTPPPGISIASDGRITGAALDVGLFPLVVEATDAVGLTSSATLTLDVSDPSIPLAELGSPFLLTGPPLDSLKAGFLDRRGNDDGSYDLGDFRAWVLAHPGLPLSAELSPAAPKPRVITVPMRPGGSGGAP